MDPTRTEDSVQNQIAAATHEREADVCPGGCNIRVIS